MDFYQYDCDLFPVAVNISRFPGPDGVDEYHLIVRPTKYGSIEDQLQWVSHAYQSALDSMGLNTQTTILRRFFCSDLLNQTTELKTCSFSNPDDTNDPCAVSWVGQPPAGPAKLSLWAYHINDPSCELEKSRKNAHLSLKRGDLIHHWTTGITHSTEDTAHAQTCGIFEKYVDFLREQNLTLADHVIRTWLFVENIDTNYQEMVVARKRIFAEHGLTPDTHFIASSGIESKSANVTTKVFMDAYAISGVRPEQIEFLEALDHLSPTQIYGVTFERGTSVSYQDRKHVIISGTASIDHQGNILHPGNVSRQLDRTLENMEALLKQANASFKDMCVFIVYIRDPSDLAIAQQQMRERFGDAPVEMVVAPVCRPGWLIEVEGLAIIPAFNPELPPF